ncbi:MAG: hypothetical protein K6L74_08710 [Neptuniibacter sp.]
MLKLNLIETEKNLVSTFVSVGQDMLEEARVSYMFNHCTKQVNGVIDEVHLQLYVQGGGEDQDVALYLSSAIGEVYPDFQPSIHSEPIELIDQCHSFLIEVWGQSAIDAGLERGWFVGTDQGGVNLTPSYKPH